MGGRIYSTSTDIRSIYSLIGEKMAVLAEAKGNRKISCDVATERR